MDISNLFACIETERLESCANTEFESDNSSINYDNLLSGYDFDDLLSSNKNGSELSDDSNYESEPEIYQDGKDDEDIIETRSDFSEEERLMKRFAEFQINLEFCKDLNEYYSRVSFFKRKSFIISEFYSSIHYELGNIILYKKVFTDKLKEEWKKKCIRKFNELNEKLKSYKKILDYSDSDSEASYDSDDFEDFDVYESGVLDENDEIIFKLLDYFEDFMIDIRNLGNIYEKEKKVLSIINAILRMMEYQELVSIDDIKLPNITNLMSYLRLASFSDESLRREINIVGRKNSLLLCGLKMSGKILESPDEDLNVYDYLKFSQKHNLPYSKDGIDDPDFFKGLSNSRLLEDEFADQYNVRITTEDLEKVLARPQMKDEKVFRELLSLIAKGKLIESLTECMKKGLTSNMLKEFFLRNYLEIREDTTVRDVLVSLALRDSLLFKMRQKFIWHKKNILGDLKQQRKLILVIKKIYIALRRLNKISHIYRSKIPTSLIFLFNDQRNYSKLLIKSKNVSLLKSIAARGDLADHIIKSENTLRNKRSRKNRGIWMNCSFKDSALSKKNKLYSVYFKIPQKFILRIMVMINLKRNSSTSYSCESEDNAILCSFKDSVRFSLIS